MVLSLLVLFEGAALSSSLVKHPFPKADSVALEIGLLLHPGSGAVQLTRCSCEKKGKPSCVNDQLKA
eukprot:5532190-Amphidinium_carterae.1